MEVTLPASWQKIGKQRINRAPSPLLARATPWLAIMLGSLAPFLPIVASAPFVPPLGYLMLIAWLQVRPGLLPVWAGLPLGLFDDLFSGQVMGTAVVLWSVTVIVIDYIETRFPWRGFLQDWLLAASAITAMLVACLALTNLGGATVSFAAIAPQCAISVAVYPLLARLVGALDRFRLIPIRKL